MQVQRNCLTEKDNVETTTAFFIVSQSVLHVMDFRWLAPRYKDVSNVLHSECLTLHE